jgi:hypothetical protein
MIYSAGAEDEAEVTAQAHAVVDAALLAHAINDNVSEVWCTTNTSLNVKDHLCKLAVAEK